MVPDVNIIPNNAAILLILMNSWASRFGLNGGARDLSQCLLRGSACVSCLGSRGFVSEFDMS